MEKYEKVLVYDVILFALNWPICFFLLLYSKEVKLSL